MRSGFEEFDKRPNQPLAHVDTPPNETNQACMANRDRERFI